MVLSVVCWLCSVPSPAGTGSVDMVGVLRSTLQVTRWTSQSSVIGRRVRRRCLVVRWCMSRQLSVVGERLNTRQEMYSVSRFEDYLRMLGVTLLYECLCSQSQVKSRSGTSSSSCQDRMSSGQRFERAVF